MQKTTLITLICLGACGGPPVPPAEDQPAPSPYEQLEAGDRAALQARMGAHASDVRSLEFLVGARNHGAIALAAEGVISRMNLPPAGQAAAGPLSAALPPEYFAAQAAIRADGERLLALARAEAGPELDEVYASMLQTCAGCHEAHVPH